MSHALSCSKARGIFLGQGSNSRLLHWQANSLPLSHQKPQTHFFEELGFLVQNMGMSRNPGHMGDG